MHNYKKNIIWTLVSATVLVNLALFGAGNYFYGIIMNYNVSDRYTEAEFEEEVEAVEFNQMEIEALESEEVELDSEHGYKLAGTIIKNETPTEDTVVLVHGIGNDREWSVMKYGKLFLEKGYNLFIYDSRGHGESGGENPSYGYYEKDDLRTCISYVKSRYPNGDIGVHGESLGASTMLMYAKEYGEEQDVSFYIEDCGYSDIKELYIARAGDYGVPDMVRPLLIDYLSLVCKLRSGFYLGDIAPIDDIQAIDAPIMFIHGERDDFTPPSMVTDMYEKKMGKKYLYVAENAGHAESINASVDGYSREVDNFLDALGQGRGN